MNNNIGRPKLEGTIALPPSGQKKRTGRQICHR
uniref:Uncharacterized protein n=1 Tax=Arundo donax TaxID=35708 RepID=A0A0A8ZLG1_ARUDO